MSDLEKSLKEQLESVINENQKLLEKHFEQDSKIVKLVGDNEYYKNKLQQKENIIKEVREKLIKSKEYQAVKSLGFNSKMSILIELEEILDKE